ncbi:MAG: histidine kinase [Bacteroidota bacterium]
MKTLFKTIGAYLQSQDSWLYWAVFLILAGERTVHGPLPGWEYFSVCLGLLLVLYAPLWLWAHFRKVFKARFALGAYMGIWLVVFVVYAGLAACLVQRQWADYLWYFQLEDYLMALSLGLALLDVGLEANRYWQQSNILRRPFFRFGFDGALLIVLALVSLLFGMMTVSNLDDFYNRELLPLSIDLPDVLLNFVSLILFAVQYFLLCLTLYFFYLLNDRLLIPYLLKKRGILVYAIGALGSIALFFPLLSQLVVMLPLTQSVPSLMPNGSLRVFSEENALIPFIVMVCSLPMIIALNWFQQNQAITQLEKQQVSQELHLLKQQINPHFFFNTLNNLYSLSLEKSDQSPEVILKLSDLMRYVIYKGSEKEVSLKEELQYIKDYIELQQIRLHKKLELKWEETLQNPAVKIPPLLLIILVENAFKHGVEPAEENCFLHIRISSKEREVHVECRNSFESPLPKKQGIGLANLRRRLSLRFPDSHHLNTQFQDQTFMAKLELWNLPA